MSPTNVHHQRRQREVLSRSPECGPRGDRHGEVVRDKREAVRQRAAVLFEEHLLLSRRNVRSDSLAWPSSVDNPQDRVFPDPLFRLVSINYHLSRHPSPWKRVKSFEDEDIAALLGLGVQEPIRIKPAQGET